MESADELPLVMREIADALGARTAVLTMHPGNGIDPTILFSDADNEVDEERLQGLIDAGSIWPANDATDETRWSPCDLDGGCRDMMTIPVKRVPGHSRLVVTAFFDGLTDEVRTNATAAYLRRRPFAIGYFRLLQLDRARARRMLALENALNVTELGVFLIDRSNQLVFANECGERILGDEEALRFSRGGLHACNKADEGRLQTVLEHVVHESSRRTSRQQLAQEARVLSLPRGDGRAPLVVTAVAPQHRAEEPNDVSVIVFAIDPGADLVRLIQPICKLYGLTPVETRLVGALISSKTIAEAAGELKVKELTARAYLRSVFAKTGTKRQTEVVILILTSVIRTTRSITSEAVLASAVRFR